MAAEDKDDTNDPGMVNDDGMYHQKEPLNFEKVWQMFQETDKKFQETERILQRAFRKIGGLGNNIGEF